ncbi:unnamed protein product [Parnassius apollo]|uniref:(apollo) hypothetical protein n=1 Tax=Parnassius apollo TaxID=110799 RepID=A0A8S3W1W2_PARAO|nr:unnamed protein product [Parnassius apollo]
MIKEIYLFLFATSCLVHEFHTSEVPFIKSCNAGDHECLLVANTQIAIPYIADGISELGIPALEPMHYENITIDQGFFKLILQNMKVTGSRKCKIAEMKRNFRESTMKMTLDCPLEATGRYIFSGSLWYHAISNEADFLIHADSIRTIITFKIEEIRDKDGKTYMNLIDYIYLIELVENLHLEFGDSFSSNIGKVQPYLRIINNEWWYSVANIGEPIASAMVQNFFNVMKLYFLRVPVENI